MANNNLGRKIIAPIIITVLITLSVIGQVAVFLFATPYLPFWVSAIAIIASLIFLGIMGSVLLERIRDIKSGEEDDLDNY